MLKIRLEQFEAFERKAHQDFEDELVAHLRKFSPQHAEGVGDDGLRALIRSGLRRARAFGFQLRGSLRFYVECQVMFGHEFHNDPLLPWAEREFGNSGWIEELARADEIHEVAMTYRKSVVGEREKVEAAAIERLLARPVDEWLRGDLDDAATAKLAADVYPEKVSQAGPDAASILIARGKRSAAAHELPTAMGGRVITALMFGFGHGVMTDPQFPWIAGNLEESVGRPPQVRVEALAVRALAYLSDALASLKRG